MVNIKLIEEKRAEHGYSQDYLAEQLGYTSHVAYSRKVSGQRQFSIEDIAKLCSLFSLTPNDLILFN